MVTLFQSLLSEAFPNFFLFDGASLLDRDSQVAAFDSEIETGHRVLHEVQSDLREALLLQVGDDTLTDKVGCTDDLQDFIVVFLDQRELESVLCRVDGDGSRLCLSIQTVDGGALYSSQIDWLLQSLDDTVVTVTLSL